MDVIYSIIVDEGVIVLKKIPLGIQSFRKIIEGGYVYVDKTQYIYDLLSTASYCFLSRPRRFGKSLLLDTIGEVLSGNKDLFKGLWIYSTDYEFVKHPVLRLDMSNIANKNPEVLENSLIAEMQNLIKKEGFDITHDVPSDLFKTIIEALYRKHGQRVVVLIDEYDKPILDHIDEPDTAEANRKVLKGFFGVLKSMDPYLRLTFITGVTKFTKTSIFSELNNLLDITMTKKYSNICGIAVEDLDNYFSDHIRHLEQSCNPERYGNIHDTILAWYDGYSWDGRTRVINPFSLLSFFMQQRFSSFWYSSGTPTFLIKLIKDKPSSFLALEKIEISERTLDTFDIRKMSIAPLLFQTGYLTIDKTSFRGDSESYLLKTPNLEVTEAFHLNIVAELTENDEDVAETAYWRIKESLRTGDLQDVPGILKALFASIPYQLHVDREAYYHSIFLAILIILGFNTDAEVSTAKGRIDAVLELDDKVYILEFKYKGCEPDTSQAEKQKLFEKALEEGMMQIKDRGYARKYAQSGKNIYLAAFAFLGRDDIEMRVESLETRVLEHIG